MTDVVLQFVVENLLPKIKENYRLITDIWEADDDLSTEVNRLKAFLQDAAQYRCSNSEQWKLLVGEVQLMVYQAEDNIDKLRLNEEMKNKKSKFQKFCNAPTYGKNLRHFAKEINVIINKANKLRDQNQEAFQKKPMLDYQQQEIVSAGQGSQNILLEDNEVVGFDEAAKDVIDRLVRGTNKLDVIPVVGLPGLGKTTLATKVYNDLKNEKTNGFFKKIWVHVGRECKREEVLISILKNYRKDITAEEIDEKNLVDKIRQNISRGGKCLIVLDNVWKPNVVDLVKNVFPKSDKGHRILITTRERPVARYASDNPHNLKFLTEEEGFQLLERRVFGSNRKCPEELVEYGNKIVDRCGGLPLALVVVAGALRGRTAQKEWKMISTNVGKYLVNEKDPDSCLKYVEISYDHLPAEMKPCFLYCAAFPRGFKIPAWKLIRLWVAEGLVNSDLEEISLEDTAECYLNELVNRNLVMVLAKRADGQIKTCRLHDMLHQFCKLEAKNNNLVVEVSKKSGGVNKLLDPGTSRRLCIQFPLLKDLFSKEAKDDFFSKNSEHVRSFLCFSEKHNVDLDKIPPFPEASPLIRVLDFQPFNYFFTADFENLFYFMRYLALSSTSNNLPIFFGTFQNLQTLIFNTMEGPTIDIKADIWKMLQLRHLHTNFPAILSSPPAAAKELSSSSYLQTLSKVTPQSCTANVLARACNLKKVSIQGEMTEFFETNEGRFKNFEKLKCLEKLKLLNVSPRSRKNNRIPLTFLRFLSKLKKLTLSNTNFAWSDANILGELECLEILKLHENAFDGTTWDVSKGFSKLKVLWIKRAKFETWTWRDLNFPFRTLRRLVLISCVKLEAIPIEFAGVSSLQELTLDSSVKASTSARAIETMKKNMYKHKRKAEEIETRIGSSSDRAPESFKFKLTILPN